METPTIAAYVRQRRAGMGKTQQQIADVVGTSAARIAQIENGTVKLPGADMRRRLAAALGVSHLDILIAAGEITEEELVEIGVQGVVAIDPDRQAIIDRINRVQLTGDRYEALEDILDGWIRRDRDQKPRVDVHHP